MSTAVPAQTPPTQRDYWRMYRELRGEVKELSHRVSRLEKVIYIMIGSVVATGVFNYFHGGGL